MANKQLRILIADRLHAESLQAERLLNQMGYYRIATATSLDEVRLLGRFTGRPFDVLIISGSLIANEPLDGTSLSGVSLNGLIYHCQYLPHHFNPLSASGTSMQLPGPLKYSEVRDFMLRVDSEGNSRNKCSIAEFP
ncbi:hypothetical protein JVX91_19765 [Pseudomonas sp. PDNC002]|uniref:hypothetical protein n=1 Tax=Pseudomonas sp. PDNC002 TaxID=2811422 RepID=UPI001966401B|nr:hypothetical protein [Pseudomonas sp. PDNC002]QRY77824.1 hypothetical protein JVX91_19765 [Pseudomonas sp. PDNC002]